MKLLHCGRGQKTFCKPKSPWPAPGSLRANLYASFPVVVSLRSSASHMHVGELRGEYFADLSVRHLLLKSLRSKRALFVGHRAYCSFGGLGNTLLLYDEFMHL